MDLPILLMNKVFRIALGYGTISLNNKHPRKIELFYSKKIFVFHH